MSEQAKKKKMSAKVMNAVGLVFVLLMVAMVEGQVICNVPIADLMACRPAVTPPNPAKPSQACCSALSHANFECLCGYKNSQVLPSLGIDPNLAMQLPRKCNLPNAPTC